MLSIKQKEELNKTGFLFLKEFNQHLETKEIANSFGEILDVENEHPNNKIELIQKLQPKKNIDARKNSYSSFFGYNEFPLHWRCCINQPAASCRLAA